MKRAMVILSVAVTLFTSVVLYGGYVDTQTTKTLPLEEVYNASFPVQLPDVIVQP